MYTTVITEMFSVRNYSAPQPASDFKYSIYKSNNTLTGDNIEVFKIGSGKLTVGIIKECISYMTTVNSTRAIIIYMDTVTPLVRKLVLSSTMIILELFHIDELSYNVTKHVLVPKHERATATEIQQVSKYIVQLPRILHTDPVSRFLGFTRGDVIKVTRNDKSITFRIVV